MTTATTPAVGETVTCALCGKNEVVGPDDGFVDVNVPGLGDDDVVCQPCSAKAAGITPDDDPDSWL